MRLLLTIVALFCVSTFGATNCLQIHSALQIAELQKKNLLKKQTELEARFSAAISRDVDAQAEGVINSIHRNEAKKVFFAQKRLKTAIQKKQSQIKQTLSYYCNHCAHAHPYQKKSLYCEACPDARQCAGGSDL